MAALGFVRDAAPHRRHPSRRLPAFLTVDPRVRDVVELGVWILAILLGLGIAILFHRDLASSRRLRAEDLRWRRASVARDVLARIDADRACRDAIAMLEWAGSRFEIVPGNRQEIRAEDVSQALNAEPRERPYTDKDLYIRDCFGALGDALELVEHDLRTGLIEFRDVDFPMSHTVVLLRRNWAPVFGFLERSGYDLALALIERFPQVKTS